MQTIIDSTMTEISDTTASQAETQQDSEPGKQLTGWLIVAATTILAYLIFRLVMLELDVHSLLDDLMAMAGQSPLPKS